MTRWSRLNERLKGLRFRDKAPVSYWLMIANLVAFLFTWVLGDPEAILATWGLTPGALTGSPSIQSFATIFSSMFLHAGWLHLGANMSMLYVCGRFVEPELGSRRFGALYLVGGLVAVAAQVLIDPTSAIPMVGASGALSGLLGAAMIIAPKAKVWVVTPFTLFIPVPMRMATLGVLWTGLQIAGLVFADPFGGGIAYAAHIGGFLGGYWFMRAGWLAPARRPKTRRPTTDVRTGPAPSAGYSTFFVTDARGRTFVFHAPEG